MKKKEFFIDTIRVQGRTFADLTQIIDYLIEFAKFESKNDANVVNTLASKFIKIKNNY